MRFGHWSAPPALRQPYNRKHPLDDLSTMTHAIEEGQRVAAQLRERIDPGTSLGSARPKLTIEDRGAWWLAKFPGKDDRCNLQRVEFATLELARQFSLDVAHGHLDSVGGSDVPLLLRLDHEVADGGYLRIG